jgi:Xaa-Pro aminopeptidase
MHEVLRQHRHDLGVAVKSAVTNHPALAVVQIKHRGETQVDPTSTQFGTQYLRMDMDLEPGMVFTIEPGLYFVPAILNSPEFRERFKTQVNWAAAEKFLAMNGGRGFGGLRIEDDVTCTATGVEVLTQSIPKARAEIEALAGSFGA